MRALVERLGRDGGRGGRGVVVDSVLGVLFGAAVGVACGLASALFLAWLGRATAYRQAHEQLVYLLPFAGLALGWVYERWGAPIQRGQGLILDAWHDDTPQVPLRMAPMALLGTVLTHLFGGSAGREGTAVQMGGSLADALAHRLGLGRAARRHLLSAGIAGGFGAVFGTPLAGAVFGLEVVAVGRLELGALLPALVAALVGDRVVRLLGVAHDAYPRAPHVETSVVVLGKLALMGVAMALAAIAFIELTHRLKGWLGARIPRLPLRMFVGGVAIVALFRVVGTSDYLGLGVPTILRAFRGDDVAPWAFALKLLFTAITLASGFVGGEVTPLFFVGATLGSVLARALGLPLPLGAGVGLAAVFGAAANTPLALSIMAVELLGAAVAPHVVVVCAVAFLLTGHRGIYPAQRFVRRKHGPAFDRPRTVEELRSDSR